MQSARNRSRTLGTVAAVFFTGACALAQTAAPPTPGPADSAAAAAPAPAAATTPATPATPATPTMTLYTVGYTHLDTQWRWSYPQVIAEFLRKTMEDNFTLLDKYPDYLFNFTGANRYMMMKEYFPDDFARLKKYVAAGRWFPAGSSMEEGDVDMPDAEAIIRQVLYGNQFFRREFNKASEEFMLPDCFGFQASLPSVLAHCGIKGFSTQKLTWGSAVGIPFNVGVWIGPDGRSVIAALNPGDYNGKLKTDLSTDPTWVKRLTADGKATGVYVDYRYYGSGDRGGSVGEDSCKWLERSVHGSGPVHVISAAADQMFKDLTPQQVAKLPRYSGDLLLTNHSTGSLSSQAFVKRCNRKLEQLADAAERASVAADYLQDAPYPRQKIFDAWRLLLGAHFHDTMAGTALPKAYEYTWNNLTLAFNAFAAVDTDAVGGVAAAMDTRSAGTPLVVYNPLSIDRTDLVQATVPAVGDAAIGVADATGKPVDSQLLTRDAGHATILFRATVPPIGFARFDIGATPPPAAAGELKATASTLENARLKVTISPDGDIESVFDKSTNRPVLTAPARLAFLYEKPSQFPAWNMDWEDRSRAPLGYVDGPATVSLVENGPVRATLEITRRSRGSTFVQRISLDAGGARVDVHNRIDWNTRGCSLEAVFPLAAGNPLATYESQSAAVQRGNNNPKKFEVPQQQWLDLTDASGNFGTAILNDCKYGSDKPDDHTIRLTLLYTPAVAGRDYQDQATQDIGRHEFTYSIAPHAGSFAQGDIPWQAAMLNQPLQSFVVAPHGGIGGNLSLAQTSSRAVSISALKKAEESGDIIVRLKELTGQPATGVALSFPVPIESAREVDGQEREIGPARLADGKLITDLPQFGLRAFAVHLAAAPLTLPPPQSQPITLQYDLDALSTRANPGDGAFDAAGRTYPAEAMPPTLDAGGIHFTLGPTADGQNNALTCHGQTLTLPPNQSRVYLLASAIDGDQPATFTVGDQPAQRTVQQWTGYIGQWDNRIWQGVIPALTYSWTNHFAGLQPGFIKRDPVAWFSPVRHDPTRGIEYYQFSYLFEYSFDVPRGATTLTLPDNPRVRIFAASTAASVHDQASPAMPLYDTLADQKPMPAPTNAAAEPSL
jgi:alpha-mannosidase